MNPILKYTVFKNLDLELLTLFFDKKINLF